MKSVSLAILFTFVFISFAFSQWNPDTILIWDNDRGLSRQTFPAVGTHDGRVFVAWQDSRWGDFDIYRQTLYWDGVLNGKNEPVSIDDYNRFRQIYPDITANPANAFVTVWEDSSYRPPNRTQILCRIQDWDVFRIDDGATSRKQPSIDSRESGEFVATWVHYDFGNLPTIMFGLYDRDGLLIRKQPVRQPDLIKLYVPVSRVAYCDSGFLVVYEDSSGDGTQRSIYGNYYKYDGALIDDHKKISWWGGSDSRNEQCPDVAVNNSGQGVAVWQDNRAYEEIWAQKFIFHPSGLEFDGPEMQITSDNSNIELRPRVTIFPTGDFVVVWYEKGAGADSVCYYRAYVNSSLKSIDSIPVNCASVQMYPDVHTRYGETVVMTWMSRALSPYEDIFVRTWALSGSTPTGLLPITADIKIIPSSPDTGVGGRRCWYFDDENYDNPLTPWNEDPVDEPDSVYVDLEFAMFDQLMELNTNGQYFVVVSETLPIRYQGILGLSAYEALLLDFGYRTGDASAGVMSSTENDSLRNEIINGAAAMMEGNDFGYMYSTSTLFRDCFYASYKGDGAPYTIGNIDTLYGVNLFARDETLKYDYQDLVDNYVDSIEAISPGRNILLSGNPLDRWMAFRSVGWGNYFDDEGRLQGNALYHTFPLSGITSTDHPNTYSEFYRRCMGFLGLNCQPEPITNLAADTVGYGEGKMELIWTIVSDDSLGDPCNSDYTLKFSRTKMTNDAEFNAAEEYYQTWTTPGAYGDTVKQSLGGLPPLDTLIFALKVEDEDGLINALGAEPQMVIPGDSVTPHTIMIGDNYVKDFSNAYEMLQAHTLDTLFVSWDASYFYIGFTRFSFNGSGDFFVYMDVTSDGADSTYPHNGSTGVSRFYASPNIFYPDYVFVVEDNSTYRLYRGTAINDGRDNWTSVTFNGSFMEDNVVNGYQYTEIAIPFSDIGYNTSNSFKLIVIVQDESSNNISRIYPINNPIGSSQIITQYYYWSNLGSGRVPNQTYQVIGIAEQDSPIQDHAIAGFEIIPNPSNGQMQFVFPANMIAPAKLTIYDVTGRQVIEQGFDDNSINTWNWNAIDKKGNRLPTGIYFVELESGPNLLLKKIVLLK